MDVRVGLWRKLSAKELMLLNCGVGEDSWESLGCKEIQPVNPKENQSWIFIGRTEAEVEAPILYLMWRADLLVKTLMLGKVEDRRGSGWQRMRWLDGIINSMDMSLSKFWKIVEDRGAWWARLHGSQRVRHDLAIEVQQRYPINPTISFTIQIIVLGISESH